jgi:hypothetical protein
MAMTDDVEETLASLEQRLRALQAELDADEEAPAEPPSRRFAPRVAPLPPRPSAAAPPPPLPTDALDRFGAELRRLVDVWERTVAELRGSDAETTSFRGGVALEARGDLADLCQLERALRGIDGVTSVNLRAYAGGAAALEVALDREVALVGELRRSLAFSVVEVRGGRLSIALG